MCETVVQLCVDTTIMSAARSYIIWPEVVNMVGPGDKSRCRGRESEHRVVHNFSETRQVAGDTTTSITSHHRHTVAMRKRFHGLKKPKPRQDWSKWTLYNIQRMQTPFASSKTFFQQKWLAKSLTRSYHGEQIREGQWTRMFDRRLPAVVPMDYRKLARSDGSDQAAGRGSGVVREEQQDDQNNRGDRERRPRKQATTPYMHMTYHPTERRLDTAIFRALFSSSTRQARQFVVHGFVKVNGKKVLHSHERTPCYFNTNDISTR